MQHVFIINPVSGKENAAKALVPAIESAAANCGIQPVIITTQHPRHATEIAQAYGKAGAPARLYAVGGDGTLNEIFNGAYPFAFLEVASVPCGSGNDFVRNFGTVEHFLNLEALIKGTAITIDLMQTDAGVCAAITSTGLDAEVAYNIPKFRRIPFLGGTMAYNLSIVEKVLHPLGKTLHITVDDQTITGKYLIATVCNGRTYGGGYIAAPFAQLDDGVLEVILVKKISRLLIASIIGKYKHGKHFTPEGEIIPELRNLIYHLRGKEVIITPAGNEPFILNIDGECGPASRLYAKVLPAAARFVLPQGLQQ